MGLPSLLMPCGLHARAFWEGSRCISIVLDQFELTFASTQIKSAN